MRFRKLIFLIPVAFILVGSSSCALQEVEQTNETLTVAYYGTDYGADNDILTKAMVRYMQTYHGVELVIQREPYSPTDGGQGYFTKLAAEVMSGEGPDLFWINTDYMNVYKMADAGAFADLTPFMAEDPDFAGDAYNQAVLEGSRYKNAQYVMPLSYSIPLLIGEKSTLDRVGFDYEHCGDFLSLWDELSRYAERFAEDPSLPRPLRITGKVSAFPNFSGIPWADYENQKIDLTAPEWKTIFDCYKPIYDLWEEPNSTGEYYAYTGALWIRDGKALFDMFPGYGCYNDSLTYARLITSGGEPVLLPFYDLNGTLQAEVREAVSIRRTSPNQQNAYNFIKILLDPELLTWRGGFGPSNIPLSNQQLETTLALYEQEMPSTWTVNENLNASDFKPVSPDVTRAFLNAARNIGGVYYNTDMMWEFRPAMKPYLTGEKGYEETIKDAKKTLEIYISE